MEILEAKRTFEKLFKKKTMYSPAIHCPMVLSIVSKTGRATAFCKESGLSICSFQHWLATFPLFREHYGLGLVYAKETWEEEFEERKDDESFNVKEWVERGNRIFKMNATQKLHLNITPNSNPYQQYQQIMEQAVSGEFTATEIKLLMESINVGTRVYESFKLQEEVDKMKDDLNLMASRNGNNIVAITKAS